MREVLDKLAAGKISVIEAEKLLKMLVIQEIDNLAKLDIGREIRSNIPEIILAEGKTSKDIVQIALTSLKEKGNAIISRVEYKHIEALKKTVTENTLFQLNEKAKMIVIKRKDFTTEKTGGKVGILTAGTSDIPIAEEARIVAEEMGSEVITAYDVGVAGIHRLFPPLKEMVKKDVDVIVVVAGREGALPSVVAGIIDIPVIAVPTSIGYGSGEKGIAALNAMLQACSLGLSVVNIDNGVAAGAVSSLIANRVAKVRRHS